MIETDRGNHFFLVDQFLCDLHAAFVLGFVIALDQLDLTPQYAAFGIDLGNGEFTPSRIDVPIGAEPARERARYTNLDRVCPQIHCRPLRRRTARPTRLSLIFMFLSPKSGFCRYRHSTETPEFNYRNDRIFLGMSN